MTEHGKTTVYTLPENVPVICNREMGTFSDLKPGRTGVVLLRGDKVAFILISAAD